MESVANRFMNEFIIWILGATLAALVLAIVWLLVKLKQWHRRRKVDNRIVRQVKAAGIWDKPQVLGGRALEIKAWEDFKIKRELGETDAQLRRRCTAKADEEYANTQSDEETICGVTGNKCSNCSPYGCGSKRRENRQ